MKESFGTQVHLCSPGLCESDKWETYSKTRSPGTYGFGKFSILLGQNEYQANEKAMDNQCAVPYLLSKRQTPSSLVSLE